MARDGMRAGTKSHHALKVLCLVFIIGYRTAIAIQFVTVWTPAGGVPLRNDAMNAIWRKKAVIDALPETVLVDRISEIQIGVTIVSTQRGCCHAKLISGLEVIEDNTPRTVISGTAAVTFVDNDQIE